MLSTAYKHTSVNRYHVLILLVCFLLSLHATILSANKLEISKLKAGYIYNFAKFVTWPKDNTITKTSFTICVMDDSDISNELQPLKDRKIFDQAIKIVEITKNNWEYAKACQVLYLGKATLDANANNIVNRSSILTVSDRKQDSIIYFKLSSSKLKFGVNLAKAKKAGLQVSSQLLNLAEAVEE